MLNCCLFCFGYCVILDLYINNIGVFFLIYRKIDELEKYINSIDDDMEVVGRNMELEIDLYIEFVIVEYIWLFCFGCYSGDIIIVIILLKYVNKYVMDIIESCYRWFYWVMNLLFIVCFLGYLEIIKILINIEVNINYKIDIFILFIGVCENGYISVVELLIDIGVDVNVVCIDKLLLIVVCW